MRVAIIGAGFGGLAAGYELAKKGHKVVVYEASDKVGGLAGGFRRPGWKQDLEKYYHHIFANDKEIIGLAKEVGQKINFSWPVTACYKNDRIRRLDSPISLMYFDFLGFFGRLRMGVATLLIKLIFNGQFLERWTAASFWRRLVGEEAYKVVWERLLIGKFGSKLSQVNMAWLWARIYKRTPSLGYFEGGFQTFADKLALRSGKIKLNSPVKKIQRRDGKIYIDGEGYDKVISTVPYQLLNKMVGGEVVTRPKIDYLWGQTMILQLKKSMIPVYWLNILEKDWPFLVMVEHTNLVGKDKYNGNCVVYLGNYLEDGDERLKLNKHSLLKKYTPFIKRVCPSFEKSWIKGFELFQAPFAQPVFPVGYSKYLNGFETAIEGLYSSDMSSVYPFDRGTNYAVAHARKLARSL